jgi:beta-phosphoglucomutase
MIKAMIFDMDGVIIDSEPIQEKAWRILLNNHGIKPTKTCLEETRGIPASVNMNRLFPLIKDTKEIQNLINVRREIYQKMFFKNISPVKGLTTFLKKIKKNKILTAIATSSVKDWTDKVLISLNIKKYFDVIVTSEEITHSKPHPEIFIKTANKLNTTPKECLIFEDSIAGVKAAKKSGMKVVLIMTSHKKEEFKTINFAFNDFTEIKIKKLLNL